MLAIGLIIATHEEEGAEEAAAQEGAEVKKNAQVEEIEQSDWVSTIITIYFI